MEAEREEEEPEAAVPAPEQDQSDAKPPIDLFKSIFLDDDSDDDDDDEKKSVDGDKVDPQPEVDVEQSSADSRQTDPVRKPVFTGKGLFANIDFDRLNRKPSANQHPSSSEAAKPVNANTTVAKKPEAHSRPKVSDDADADKEQADGGCYGPERPAAPATSSRTTFSSETESSDDDVWTEKKSDKPSLKKKKKKEKKKKKKKESKKVKKVKRDKSKSKKKKKKNEKVQGSGQTSTETDDSD